MIATSNRFDSAVNKFFILVLGSLAFLALSIRIGAQDPPSIPSVNYVTDYVDVIPDYNEKELEKILYELEKQSGIEFRVVLTNFGDGDTTSQYCERLWKDWRIGGKGGKGVLLLFTTNENGLDWRVTEELKGELPADFAQSILQTSRNELLVNGYTSGVALASRLLIDKLGQSKDFDYLLLAQKASASLDEVPPRPINPLPDPSIQYGKFSLRVGLSVIAVILAVIFGLSLAIGWTSGILRTIPFKFTQSIFGSKDRSESDIKTWAKLVVYTVIYCSLFIYFRESVISQFPAIKATGDLFSLLGSCAFPIFGLVIFVVLLVSLRRIGRYWTMAKSRVTGTQRGVYLLLLILPIGLILIIPSDVSIIRSWGEKTGILVESTRWSRTFGDATNAYVLNGFGKITYLKLDVAAITDIGDLDNIERLSSLRKLDIRNIPSGGTLTLQSLPSLESLILKAANIRALNGLEKLPRLKELQVENLSVNDLKGLQDLPNLKSLSISNCHRCDLSGLSSLVNLEELWLDGSEVSDLTPISGLRKLRTLSIAGTLVTDLRPIAELPIGILDISNTKFSKEDIKRVFKHEILVLQESMGIDDLERGIVHLDSRFVDHRFRDVRNWTIVGLLGVILLVLLLPTIPIFRVYWLFLVRRVVGKVVWGVLLLMLLLTLAHARFPMYFINGAVPSSAIDNLWIAIFGVAIFWVGLRPLLLVALETKHLNSSMWSVPAGFALKFMPVLVISGSLSFMVVSSIVHSEKYLIAIFSGLFILVIVSLPLLIISFFAIISTFNWQRRLMALQGLSNDRPGTIIEIPLKQRLFFFSSGRGEVNFQRTLFDDSIEQDSYSMYSAASIGMLCRLPEGSVRNVGASFITIREQELNRMARWEINLIDKWVGSVFTRTWAPSWIISDWAETFQPPSKQVEENFEKLRSLQPYLSGFARRAKIGASILPLNEGEGPNSCIVANILIPRDKLDKMNFGAFVESSFTPVAVLSRSVFGQPFLEDRMDVLVRTVEIAIAFFSLALVAEYESDQGRTQNGDWEKIQRGVNFHFSKPLEFGGWRSILKMFARQKGSEFATEISSVLDGPAAGESDNLRMLLEQAAGSTAATNIPQKIESRGRSLELLNLVRNVMVAHGPNVERVSQDFYSATAAVALDLLTNLPWKAVSLHAVQSSKASAFCGLMPCEYDNPNRNSGDGVFVRVLENQSEKWIDAKKFFAVSSEGKSIAMFTGEETFFDPISGVRI